LKFSQGYKNDNGKVLIVLVMIDVLFIPFTYHLVSLLA